MEGSGSGNPGVHRCLLWLFITAAPTDWIWRCFVRWKCQRSGQMCEEWSRSPGLPPWPETTECKNKNGWHQPVCQTNPDNTGQQPPRNRSQTQFQQCYILQHSIWKVILFLPIECKCKAVHGLRPKWFITMKSLGFKFVMLKFASKVNISVSQQIIIKVGTLNRWLHTSQRFKNGITFNQFCCTYKGSSWNLLTGRCVLPDI